MAITTLAKLKTHLGITDSADDTRLTQLLSEAESGVENYCGRQFMWASYTEYLDGNGQWKIYLKNRPLASVASVHVDSDGYYGSGPNPFPSETAYTLGTDYAIPTLAMNEQNLAALVAISKYWPVGIGNIKVVYTAGYGTAPDDLELAVHLLVSGLRSAALNGTEMAPRAETFGKYSYQLLSGAVREGQFPEVLQARSILGRYIKEPYSP